MPQRGAATLVVVMILFLIMALLAAYANRSLMFEQRISAGYYRASMAQEMTDGALDFAAALLNGTATDGNCAPVANGGTRFVDRYLSISAADRSITSSAGTAPVMSVDCARTETSLICRCPALGARTVQPSLSSSGNLIPSFGFSVGTDSTTRYGSFKVTAYGCSDSSVDKCQNDVEARSQQAMGAAYQTAWLALVSAVPSSPGAPLVVKGNLKTQGTGGLGLHNTDPASAGTLVVSGRPAPALIDNRMDSVPGTPASQARIFDNADLMAMSENRFFQVFMGMTSSRYRNHPSLREVTCGQGDCGPALQAAYTAGTQILWVQGNMGITSNITLGTATAPVVVIVNGDVALSGPLQVTGLLFALGDLDWTNTGGLTSLITGMVMVKGDMTATGRMDIQYSQPIANQLRNRVGSFARVSGGWRDGTN